MNRRRLPWLVGIPLVVAGSLTAHELAYRIVTPDAAARAQQLRETGHAYLDRLPLLAGVLVASLIAGLVNRFLQRERPRLSPWALFLLPLLGFTAQEHLERLLHDGSFPVGVVLQPEFLIGLALQLPFALLAYAVAWALLGFVERLTRALRASSPRAPDRPGAARWSPRTQPPPRIAPLALGYPGRGPPQRGVT